MADWAPRDDRQEIVHLGKLAIGSLVRRGRRRLGVSQHTFGHRAGVSQSVISRLETGRLNGIRWQTLAGIIGVLDVAGGFGDASWSLQGRRDRSAR